MYAVGGVFGCTSSVDLEVGEAWVSFGRGLRGDQETVCIYMYYLRCVV